MNFDALPTIEIEKKPTIPCTSPSIDVKQEIVANTPNNEEQYIFTPPRSINIQKRLAANMKNNSRKNQRVNAMKPKNVKPKNQGKRGRKEMFKSDDERRKRKLENRRASDDREYCHQGFLLYVLVNHGFEVIFDKIPRYEIMNNKKLVIKMVKRDNIVLFDLEKMQRHAIEHLGRYKISNHSRAYRNYMNKIIDNRFVEILLEYKDHMGYNFEPRTRKNRKLDYMIDRKQIMEFTWFDGTVYNEKQIIEIGNYFYSLIKSSFQGSNELKMNFELWNLLLYMTASNQTAPSNTVQNKEQLQPIKKEETSEEATEKIHEENANVPDTQKQAEGHTELVQSQEQQVPVSFTYEYEQPDNYLFQFANYIPFDNYDNGGSFINHMQ